MDITGVTKLPHKFDITELEAFVETAKVNGLRVVTWSAFAGDQREPGQLTLTVRAE